jgi:hypothetical protein
VAHLFHSALLVGPCDLAITISHGERVAGLLPILRLVMILMAHTGVPLIEPHMVGGSMVEPHGSSLPISTYLETALDSQYCPVDNRQRTKLVGVCKNNTVPHWCEDGKAVCVMDWTSECYIPIRERRAIGHEVSHPSHLFLAPSSFLAPPIPCRSASCQVSRQRCSSCASRKCACRML